MSTYGRALTLVTGATLLVPVIGLATAPILAQSLGAAGRGAAGAALAPNLLIVGGATLGLPQALTFVLAKSPHLTRAALRWATLICLPLGVLVLLVVSLGDRYLAQGNEDLAQLIVLGTWLALPTLVVGLLRGAAFGRQMWRAIAVERVINSLLRLVLLGGLALAGRLDVVAAVLVVGIAPIVAGVAYLPLLRTPPPAEEAAVDPPLPSSLLGFGAQEWLGSVAIMLMARTSQLLVTPLAGVEQLGLLLVAVTISDLPYIVTQAIREVSFGVNSAESNTPQLANTSRVVTLVSVLGAIVVGATLPLWIGPVFGEEFQAAVVPTWLFLIASCLGVPGLLAGAGLDAAGRPGLRSLSLGAALILNVIGTIALTPPLGATGAAIAAVATTLLSTGCMLAAARRVLAVPSRQFWLPTPADVATLATLVRLAATRLRRAEKNHDV